MKLTQIVFFLIFTCGVLHAQVDKDSCKDHSLITRYPGAVIEYCDLQVYKEYRIATGAETGYKKIDDWTNTAGKSTRIYYSIKGDRTVSEVYKNYLDALAKGGFTLMANRLHSDRNVSSEVGGATWLSTFYSANPFPTNVGIRINQGSGTSGGTFYIAGNLNSPNGKVYVVVSGKQYTDKEVVVLLDVIEEGNAETDLIKVDAEYMTKQLNETGRVALQGIQFDFNAATIKPESEPLLDEIAKVMKANPTFKIYVVGHTDMKGDLKYNMDLSAQRAAAVVKYLVDKHKIDPLRLSAQGVGPLSPVATNETEEGRTKNRRVELVLISK